MRHLLYKCKWYAVYDSQILTQPFHVGFLQADVNIKWDATYPFREYKVEVANTVDLRICAGHHLVETPSGLVADIVSACIS